MADDERPSPLHGLRGPLDALSPREVSSLLAIGRRRSFAAGEALTVEGQRTADVYVLLHGRVRVVASTRDGDEVLVAIRGAGDVLGELAAFDPAPRSATVSALEAVEAVVVPAARFVPFVESRPELMRHLLQVLTRRLRTANQRLVGHRSQDTVTRLARQLLELAARYGRAEPEGLRLDVPLSQEQLASLIGSSREAVNIALRRLREAEILETARMRITVTDVDALRAVALGRAPVASVPVAGGPSAE